MVSDSTAIWPPPSIKAAISTPPAPTANPPLTRDEARTLLGKTMGLVAVTAGVFALGAYLGRNDAYQWGWVFFIGSLLLLVGVNVAAPRSERAALILLIGFGVVTGLAVAPTLAYYASTDPHALWQAGGATALVQSCVAPVARWASPRSGAIPEQPSMRTTWPLPSSFR